MYRVALTNEQRNGFIKRQTYHIGVGTDKFDDETFKKKFGETLKSLGADFVINATRMI